MPNCQNLNNNFRGKGRHSFLSANDLKVAKNAAQAPKVGNWKVKLFKVSLN